MRALVLGLALGASLILPAAAAHAEFSSGSGCKPGDTRVAYGGYPNARLLSTLDKNRDGLLCQNNGTNGLPYYDNKY